MIHINTFVSEAAVWTSIVEGFRKSRVVEQKACYLGAGLERYYNPNRTSSGDKYNYAEVTQLLAKILTDKKELNVAVVSLGCGSCETDKVILQQLHEAGYSFSFFGVDSSMAMLYKACEVLDDVTFEARLICADFGLPDFKEELDKITGDCDIKICMFFGNTLGNLDQSYIADILKNILNTGDYLLLDVSGFETITDSIQAKLFVRYRGYIDNPADGAFYLGPLSDFNIPVQGGKLTLSITEDEATSAQVFKFGFKANNSTDFVLDGMELNLTPNEHVELHHILIYDLNKLAKFLESKKFTLQDKVGGDFTTQLLFKRH